MNRNESPASKRLKRNLEYESFPLRRLNKDLLVCVIEKMNFRHYTKMLQTSCVVGNWFQGISKHLPFFIDRISVLEIEEFTPTLHVTRRQGKPGDALKYPCRITSNRIYLPLHRSMNSKFGSMKFFDELFRLLTEIQLTSKALKLSKKFRQDSELVSQLLELLDSKELDAADCNFSVSSRLFNSSIIQNLEVLIIGKCKITDEQLLSLRCTHVELECNGITEQGINRLLKSWKNGEREFSRLVLKTADTKIYSTLANIFNDLDANPIWCSELHEFSVLRQFSIEFLGLSRIRRMLFALFRSIDIDNPKIIDLDDNSISLLTNSDPYSVLNFQEANDVLAAMASCLVCARYGCKHRSRLDSKFSA